MPANALDLGVNLTQALNTLYSNGYAGIWLWRYEDDGSGGTFGIWPTGQIELTAFNQAHPAQTQITPCAQANYLPLTVR